MRCDEVKRCEAISSGTACSACLARLRLASLASLPSQRKQPARAPLSRGAPTCIIAGVPWRQRARVAPLGPPTTPGLMIAGKEPAGGGAGRGAAREWG